MSSLLKKVVDTWNATKGLIQMSPHDTPVCPPTPDLSHLTPDEINAIQDVVLRQEEFEKQEANRIKKLREELDSLQHQLSQKSTTPGNQDKKVVDLPLCRICLKSQFDDGVGRVCDDCQQRVCNQCGAMSKSRWNARKSKGDMKWCCKLCTARREILCRTGGWYHGTPAVSTDELKKKLSVVSNPDAEIEFQSGRASRESQRYMSGNRTDPELLHCTSGYPNHRMSSLKKQTRRLSLLPDLCGPGKSVDDKTDDDEDKDSLKKLLLERQLSRRRRQEKRQRQKMKPVSTGLKKSHRFDETKGDSADYSDTNTSTCSSFSDSRGPPEPITACPTPSPLSLKIRRQDAVSLSNSCMSPVTSKGKRLVDKGSGNMPASSSLDTPRGLARPSSAIKQQTRPTRSLEMQTSKDSSIILEKWRQSGFPEAYLISLQSRPRDCPYGLKVTGGVEVRAKVTKALVSWISSQMFANIRVGQEVLEWNDKTLRGHTYDTVVSATSQVCPRVILVVNALEKSEGRQSSCDRIPSISQDQPSTQSPDLHRKGAKMRILPKTPIEFDTCQIKGEIQMKLWYRPDKTALTVTVLKARHMMPASTSDSGSSSTSIVVQLVPWNRGRPCIKTELPASSNKPEWNQTFVVEGVTLTEMVNQCLQLTVWSQEPSYDRFIGEVLLDLTEAQLDNQPHWYNLEEHDENCSALPYHRGRYVAPKSTSWNNSSLKDACITSPTLSPEVPSRRNSPSSTGSSNVSPVPFGTSQDGTRELHLSTVLQLDSFTTKMKKKMRKTVSKMSPLSFIEKRDFTGSDESISSENIRRLSSKSDKSVTDPENIRRLSNKSDRSMSESRGPSLQIPSFSQSHDLLAPPRPPSRTSSCSSIFFSDDEDILGQSSMPLLTSDRPAPEGDDITSILGPGQIPPKPLAETTVCGNIKLGFMISKGHLEVDIICAASLHWDTQTQPPDTYVKTYLMEGKRVLQRKKTTIIKATLDPVYRKRIKYSASNVHGRLMKVDIWKRTSNFDKKACLGEVLVRLDGLDLSKSTVAWYKLFQMNSTEYGSDEFLSLW